MRFYIPDSVEDTSMDVEEQEQKFHQSLDHLSHNTTQLANTLVCNVTEGSPQLYVKTKLRLLNCIGSLITAVVRCNRPGTNWPCFVKKSESLQPKRPSNSC